MQRKAQEHPELELEPQRAALGMLRSTKHRFGCPEARVGLQGAAGVAAGGPVSTSVRLGGFPRGSKRKAEAGVDKENAGKLVPHLMVGLFLKLPYSMVKPSIRAHACFEGCMPAHSSCTASVEDPCSPHCQPQQHVCLVLQGLWRCSLMRICSQMLLVRAPALWAAGIA